ncbi:MAG: hypothetical protein AAB538_01670 [Patescibacteria group bacterium]
MKRLTQDEAERCAEACGIAKSRIYYQDDPLFWFGGLWDRAKELAKINKWPLELHSNENMSAVWVDYKQPIGKGKTEIEALCAAIEALQATRKEGLQAEVAVFDKNMVDGIHKAEKKE